MLSRVAGNLYWLSRYLERAEDMSRVMIVHDNLLMDLPEIDRASAWYPLVAINSTDRLFAQSYDTTSEESVMHFLIASPDNPSSLVSAINGVRYNLRSSRAIIPKSLYELLNQLCLSVSAATADGKVPARRHVFLKSVEQQLLAIAGACIGGMSHNKPYLFMRIGCYLERADMTSRILDVRSANLLANRDAVKLSPYDNRQWVAVLASLQAFQMYMAEVQGPVNGPEVLAYVLQNQTHPRSFRFCVRQLSRFLRRLPNHSDLFEQADQLLQTVDGADVRQLARNFSDLHRFMDDLQVRLAALGGGVSDHYFPLPND